MKRLLLVDCGGVLFANALEGSAFFDELARRAEVDRGALAGAYERRDREFETDATDVHDVLRDALSELGAPASVTRDLVWIDELYQACVTPVEEVFDLLRRVRRGGRLKLAMANNEAKRWDRVKDNVHQHLQLFDHLASSWALAQVKPEPAYFEAALAMCRASAEDCLLIDDNPEVTAAATSWGLESVLFLSATQLKQELMQREILLDSDWDQSAAAT